MKTRVEHRLSSLAERMSRRRTKAGLWSSVSERKKLRANSVTALRDTRNRPLQCHQGIRKACVNGGCQGLSVVPILWLQVTSIDKRIDFPRIHLDRDQLPPEFLAPAKETNPLRRSFRVAHLRCELR
jgi:hypothetical protein